MRKVFDLSDVEAVLQVIVNNALNCLSHQVVLRNISILCVHPLLESWLIHIERILSFILMATLYFPQEGTTQGDPLVMPMYALGVVSEIGWYWCFSDVVCGQCLSKGLLTNKVSVLGEITWFVWDLTMDIFQMLLGPALLSSDNIYVKLGFCFMALVWSSLILVGVTLALYWILRNFWTVMFKTRFLHGWVKLSEIAITQSQAAYMAFTHVFLHHWLYISRTALMISELFHPLDDVLILRFLPAMTSQLPFSSIEHKLLSMPGGLGVIVPSIHFSSSFLSLSRVTAPLVDYLLRKGYLLFLGCVSANVLMQA